MKASSEEFLRYGNFGPLKLGISRSSIESLLGQPDDMPPRGEKPIIWKYGDLQLTFAAEELILIAVHFKIKRKLNLTIILNEDILKYETTIDEMRNFFQVRAIACYIDLDLTFEEQTCIVSGIGVNSTFDKQHLDSVQFSGRNIATRWIRSC